MKKSLASEVTSRAASTCPSPLTTIETDFAMDVLAETCSSVEIQDDLPRHGIVQVCHVSMTLRTGGLERLLVEFARKTDRRRFGLHFIALADAGPPADEIRQMGLAVRALGFPKTGKPGLIRALRNYMQDHEIDVVHTHNTYAHFYGALAAKSAGVRAVVNTQHGRGCGNGWKDRLLFRLANRCADRVIGVSDDATHLCQGQDRLSAGKTERIWNGIDVSRFAFQGPRNEMTAVSVARLSPEKDFQTMLRAVAIVVRQVPQFRLRIVGDGQERDALEALSRELGLESHIEFLGERSDVPDLLANAGFFLSSSRTEGVSLTLLEAMGIGLPIVTTTVGGNPEVVVEGVTGLLVPPENPEALAAAIVRMCESQASWKSMAAAARERVETMFDITTTVRAYEDLYADCLREKRPSKGIRVRCSQ
jgi:glycosyltransferase involved in cell wall biosynthesis